MRKLQKPPAEELRKRKEEPLTEGLQFTVPTDSRGRRLWSKMSDEQVVEYTRKVMEEKGISGRKELMNADRCVYKILRRRGLLGKVGFEEKRRSWEDIDDEEIVEYARKVMEEKGISGRTELRNADSGLYAVLEKKGLLEEVGFEEKRKRRAWKDLGDEEIVENARRLMEENGITGRSDFGNADQGLYKVLKKRRLLDEVGFEEKRRKERTWKDMSDDEVVEFTREMIKEKNITGKRDLGNVDSGLYTVLVRRKLLEEVGFEKKQRNWKCLSDEEIIELARKVRLEKEISGRHEFHKADPRLYRVLGERGLLEEVGFVDKQRTWKDLSDEQIVGLAREIIGDNNISRRSELSKADSGLYAILQRRKLINRAFAHIDQNKDAQARDAVIDALEAFAANDNNSAEDDVA